MMPAAATGAAVTDCPQTSVGPLARAGQSLFGVRAVATCVALAVAAMFTANTAAAQTTAAPNTGALKFTGGFDLPTVYVFRGIVREADPKLTLWPYGDLGIALT